MTKPAKHAIYNLMIDIAEKRGEEMDPEALAWCRRNGLLDAANRLTDLGEEYLQLEDEMTPGERV